MSLKRIAASAAAALSLALTGGCAGGNARAESAGSGAPGPALWRVADEDTTIYLFGTVHALPKGSNWFLPHVEAAFNASDELVTEIDLSNPAASGQALAAAGMLPAGGNLRELMTRENREQYEASLLSLGVPVGALDTMEPWLAALTLSLLPIINAGYDQSSGVETSLAARAGDKRRAALETMEQQVELFDGLPQDAQLAYLDRVVEGSSRAAATIDAMVAQWLKGDADELAVMLNQELDDDALHARLLTERNAHWADWIEQRMDAPGTVFVAVGAGHLAGKDSVQEQLEDRGLDVERVGE